jgi:hypothetical protein
MKLINKILTFTALTSGLYLSSCEEVELAEPNITTTSTSSSANFLLVNASPDAPALDFYINNVKTGNAVEAGESQATYTTVPITSNGVLANTNIRSKAATGTIGGLLGGNDLIFRAGNANTNNFQAGDKLNYTVFVVDSTDRPKPIRTLNASNFGDATYYSSRASFTAPAKVGGGDTTINLSVGSNNSIIVANLLRKYNGGNLPSFFVPIGTVPLGSSDPGGVRFYLLQDVLLSTVANQAAIRVVHVVPDAGTLHVRLNGGTPITLTGAGTSYVMAQSNFNPSVGSRTNTGAAFTRYTTLNTGTPNNYTIEVSTKSDFTGIIATVADVTFLEGKSYTIYVSGTLANPNVGIIQHN